MTPKVTVLTFPASSPPVATPHGIVGVAPQSKIIAAKVLNDEGTGTSQNIVAGIQWAIESGADILSMSLGSPEPDEEIHQALLTRYLQRHLRDHRRWQRRSLTSTPSAIQQAFLKW